MLHVLQFDVFDVSSFVLQLQFLGSWPQFLQGFMISPPGTALPVKASFSNMRPNSSFSYPVRCNSFWIFLFLFLSAHLARFLLLIPITQVMATNPPIDALPVLFSVLLAFFFSPQIVLLDYTLVIDAQYLPMLLLKTVILSGWLEITRIWTY